MQWKSLPSILGTNYEVSSEGEVKSLGFTDSWGRKKKGRILKHTIDRRGYPRIRINVNNKKISLRIHRLVAQAFIPNSNNLPQVNHINGIKTDNRVENLEWVTNQENMTHSYKIGVRTHLVGEKAARFQSSVLVFDKNGNQIDELFGNLDMKAKGYDFRNISAVILGKRKTYKKLFFKRK